MDRNSPTRGAQNNRSVVPRTAPKDGNQLRPDQGHGRWLRVDTAGAAAANPGASRMGHHGAPELGGYG